MTAAAATPMIIGVREGAGCSSGALWVKARNASVLPLGSTVLSGMRTTLAKQGTSATPAAAWRHSF